MAFTFLENSFDKEKHFYKRVDWNSINILKSKNLCNPQECVWCMNIYKSYQGICAIAILYSFDLFPGL